MSTFGRSNALLEGALQIKGNPDPEFVQIVETTLQRVSKPMSRIAELGKVKLIAADSLMTVYPQAALKKTPRGWDGGTWAQADGAYSGGTWRWVVATQYHLDSNGKLAQSSRIPGVLLHEFSHGLDEALSKFSQHPAFVRAYLADFAGFVGTPAEKKLAYFVQGFELKRGSWNAAGLQETFAEIMASVHGVSCVGNDLPVLYRCFPRCFKLLRELARGNLDCLL
jgi:hypothetical protein